ncbi:hypothetical protein BT63DRAFT_427869 [Microthyrium microscopicum]|uniref:Uncharacterized protein n=1 Tax=Microthyrium microscopicum TaxID=703497 RepID=A0A6A6U2C7_9PEZI|nr:hypothetical protein BT63DRAFT_427869 [Microthyrium microscopicum]
MYLSSHMRASIEARNRQSRGSSEATSTPSPPREPLLHQDNQAPSIPTEDSPADEVITVSSQSVSPVSNSPAMASFTPANSTSTTAIVHPATFTFNATKVPTATATTSFMPPSVPSPILTASSAPLSSFTPANRPAKLPPIIYDPPDPTPTPYLTTSTRPPQSPVPLPEPAQAPQIFTSNAMFATRQTPAQTQTPQESSATRKRGRNRTAIEPRMCRACGITYRYRRPHLQKYHAEELARGEHVGSEDGVDGDYNEDEEEGYDDSHVNLNSHAGTPVKWTAPSTRGPMRRSMGGVPSGRFCNVCGVVVEDMAEHQRARHGESTGFKAVNAPVEAPKMVAYETSPVFAAYAQRDQDDDDMKTTSTEVKAEVVEEPWEKLLRAIKTETYLDASERRTLIYELFSEQIKRLPAASSPIPRSHPDYGTGVTPQLTSSTSVDRDEESVVVTPLQASKEMGGGDGGMRENGFAVMPHNGGA